MTKACTKCGADKPLGSYRTYYKKKKDGTYWGPYSRPECIECGLAWKRAHAAKMQYGRGGNSNPNEIYWGTPGSVRAMVLKLPRGHPLREKFIRNKMEAEVFDRRAIGWENRNDLAR